jgi:hypothetical protein
MGVNMLKTASKEKAVNRTKAIATEMIHAPHALIIKKVGQLAQIICVDADELLLWLSPHQQLPTSTLVSFLHLAISHCLDPLMGEVVFWLDTQGQAHPSISIDGWMKIINQHPQFMGIEFEEVRSSGEVDTRSMKCTIYRKDRSLPIRIDEYLAEVKNDHPLWKSMPRRMLRHRALQQCARLAFGISTPEFIQTEELPSKNLSETPKVNQDSNHLLETIKVSRTDLLKERLTKTDLSGKNPIAILEESPKI